MNSSLSPHASPLSGIYEISKVLGATLDLEKGLHDTLNILASFLGLRQCAVILAGEDGKPHLAAVTGMSLNDARGGAFAWPAAAVATVMATGIPLVAPEASDEPLLADYVAQGGALDDEGTAFFCVPVKTTERPFGALSAERPMIPGSRRVFEDDLRMLTMVATLIAQTVALHRKVAADRKRLLVDNARLQKRMAEISPPPPAADLKEIIGESEPITRVIAQCAQAAGTKATVLLRGESGTGKELVAHAIHMLSPRAAKPFVKINCAALTESLLESELFGHEKGAFTGAVAERKGRFELANCGTLFLDEIGEISPAFQAKLLRVLQEGEFERVGGSKTIKTDVRLVAATNRDLEAAVTEGSFRADLYFRLNVVPIFLPPLRQRTGDIPQLARHFLDRFNAENSRSLGLSHRAILALQRCNFPGNVRELQNCIYRTATMAKGEEIQDTDLACHGDVCLSATLWKPPADAPLPPIPAATARPAAPDPLPPGASPAVPADDDLSERERLVEAMERCGWVQAKAARLLGLTPRQIGYALKKHGVEVKRL